MKYVDVCSGITKVPPPEARQNSCCRQYTRCDSLSPAKKTLIYGDRRHFGVLAVVGVAQLLSQRLYGQHHTGEGSQQAYCAKHREGQIQRDAAHHLQPKQEVRG